MSDPQDPVQWGVVASLVVSLLAVGRFLIRWEHTFTDEAREEIRKLRAEHADIRSDFALIEAENARLRVDIIHLKAAAQKCQQENRELRLRIKRYLEENNG